MTKTTKTMVLVLALAIGSGVVAMPLAEPIARAQEVREIEIVVRGGYQPSRIVVREGERVRLRFVRHEYASCTREVVFPALGIRRELPPHQPVVIELPELAVGEHEFRCGMNMVRGTIVVEPR
ncbi:cupredoxin domain-containing protein [Sandaracinus amylolyticus]|uniref:Putative secreted protein containing plastocyanin domain protein n=1 Tax=Sandaracinus amylolyticus TaxID=927083 RepID=A0A0F6VZ10_9BACT|nr:cupredoxin domain-containing protein [Sandaracinus amylolyticus]AKF03242.1 putative secreted protein containing plastocyanin domain protein [Sandaracinus amylolyticus]